MLAWQEYCKELAEYCVRKYQPTKLEILELASRKQKFYLCGGAELEIEWKSVLPFEFTEKQLEKLRSFRVSLRSSMQEIYRWILRLNFPEFPAEEDFFLFFGFDSLFWLLNLEYYKRKQKTIFQDYPLPSFDWETYRFWREERFDRTENGYVREELVKEFDNQSKLLEEYRKEVMQIAVDAVAYLN